MEKQEIMDDLKMYIDENLCNLSKEEVAICDYIVLLCSIEENFKLARICLHNLKNNELDRVEIKKIIIPKEIIPYTASMYISDFSISKMSTEKLLSIVGYADSTIKSTIRKFGATLDSFADDFNIQLLKKIGESRSKYAKKARELLSKM